ncbi:MAG TPA: hypothetical protein VGS03_13930 [Candidatus Polarisedimenticolia bacterium]|jgi:hypothetical protein|nr:hypothetical protein [Candidatus Polarisedimenticolia bacterium]
MNDAAARLPRARPAAFVSAARSNAKLFLVLAACVLGGPLLLAAGSKPVPAPEPAPLTNEDIVRLTAYGTSEAVILDTIKNRKVDFELDPGVVSELQRVGVTEKVIEAMRRRQLEAPLRPNTAPPAPAPLAATPTPARITLTFDETPVKKDPPQIYALTTLPKGAPRPDDSEVGTVSDLALAILCTSGDHVPDHWDRRTPIEGAPRHELLLFRAGSTRRKEHGFEVIALDRTPVEGVPLPPGSHALLILLAGKQSGSGSWRPLAADPIRVEAEPGKEIALVLDARTDIGGSRMTGFGLNQVWKVRLQGAPAAAPADKPASPATPEKPA